MSEISSIVILYNCSIDDGVVRSTPIRFFNMQMEHEKCLDIVFHSNAQVEPTLLYIQSPYYLTWFVIIILQTCMNEFEAFAAKGAHENSPVKNKKRIR